MKQLADPSAAYTISSGGNWDFVDFYRSWILLNGVDVIHKPYEMTKYGQGAELVLGSSTPTIKCGCAHARTGRAWLGGVSAANFWPDDYKSFFISEADRLDSPIDWESTMNADETFVMWSPIGEQMLWLLYPGRAIYGHESEEIFNNERPQILDLLERNEFCVMACHWQGNVLGMKMLGKDVVVYGDNGIGLLSPLPDSRVSYTALEYGLGLKSRGAVGGDDNVHLFLGSNDELFALSADRKIQRLGYAEFMAGTSTPIISYDPEEKEFYIGTNTTAYILSSKGLSQVHESFSTIEFLSGGPSGVKKEHTTPSKSVVSTNPDMLGIVGQKTLTSVRVIYDDFTNVEGSVGFRYGRTGSYTLGSWVNVNKEGAVFPRVTADEIFVSVRGDVGTTHPVISEIQTEWQLGDRRYFRSNRNVGQASSRAG